VGAPPTPLYADLHAVAEAAFDAMAVVLVPGTTREELPGAAMAVGPERLHAYPRGLRQVG
jgi:hypothetical protein